MRRLLLPAVLLLAPLSAEEAPAPEPLPAAPEPKLEVTGEIEAGGAGGKQVLRVQADTELPEGTILQVYLNRNQFTTTGELSKRLVNSKRFTLKDLSKPLEMPMDRPLPPAVYEVVVVCDGQRQYPNVLEKLNGLKELRRSFERQVGRDEEVALEHEWGESRVLGVLSRVDGILAGMPAQAGDAWKPWWAEQSERLGWMADRLGKIGESTPVQDVWFPNTEALLKQLCEGLRAAGDAAEGPGFDLAAHAALRAKAERTYAVELTVHVLKDLQHWLVFVHQEYWLNRIHQRLQPEQWAAFKADQRRRLDKYEGDYAAYAASKDPVRLGVSRHFPPLVSEAAGLLRRIQDAYDKDLVAEAWRPGPSSGELEHAFDGLIRKTGIQAPPRNPPRPPQRP